MAFVIVIGAIVAVTTFTSPAASMLNSEKHFLSNSSPIFIGNFAINHASKEGANCAPFAPALNVSAR